MRPGPRFVATFRPAERWSEEIRRHDGMRAMWRPGWVIGEGPFAGQTAYIPIAAPRGLAWAPESELVDREER